MTDKYKMFSAFNAVNEDELRESAEFLGYTGGRKKGRKVFHTLLAAAIIVSMLAVSAAAVGISYHRKKQDEIRQRLNIDENKVENYIEYECPENSEGLNILSCVNEGSTLHIFFNYSPVSETELKEIAAGTFYGCKLGDREGLSEALPDIGQWDFAPDELIQERDSEGNVSEKPKSEAMLKKIMERAYDAETKTISFVCSTYFAGEMPELLEIGFGKFQNGETVLLDKTVFETKNCSSFCEFLPAVIIKDEESGFEYSFKGAAFKATGCDIYVSSAEIDELYREKPKTQSDPQAQEEWEKQYLEVYKPLDRLLGNVEISFKDGSSIKPGAAAASPYRDGILHNEITWYPNTYNITDAESITIGCEKVNIS